MHNTIVPSSSLLYIGGMCFLFVTYFNCHLTHLIFQIFADFIFRTSSYCRSWCCLSFVGEILVSSSCSLFLFLLLSFVSYKWTYVCGDRHAETINFLPLTDLWWLMKALSAFMVRINDFLLPGKCCHLFTHSFFIDHQTQFYLWI